MQPVLPGKLTSWIEVKPPDPEGRGAMISFYNDAGRTRTPLDHSVWFCVILWITKAAIKGQLELFPSAVRPGCFNAWLI
jgi:hypothetical protein